MFFIANIATKPAKGRQQIKQFIKQNAQKAVLKPYKKRIRLFCLP